MIRRAIEKNILKIIDSEEYYLSEIEKINYSFPTKNRKH